MGEPNDLEERKTELFATMTLIKAAKRDLALAQARGDDQIPLIDRLADLESDRERLAHEVNSQYMYRNLQAFMNRVDAYDEARTKEAAHVARELGELRSGSAALRSEFQTQMRESQEDRRALHKEIAAVKKDVAAMKTAIAADMKLRLGRFEIDPARFGAIEASLAQLVARIGGALPTEADQELSAALRVDEAGRRGDGDG